MFCLCYSYLVTTLSEDLNIEKISIIMAEKYSWYHDYVGKWVLATGPNTSIFGRLQSDNLEVLVFNPFLRNDSKLYFDKEGVLKSNACYVLVDDKIGATIDTKAVHCMEPQTEERAKYLVDVTNPKKEDSISTSSA